MQSLNADLFISSKAYFGGGTYITLKYHEYRWSKDIDFAVCPSNSGYRKLRASVYDDGYKALFSNFDKIELPTEIKTDQYGIRFAVKVGGDLIKFEIFDESRIELGEPDNPPWAPVPCLSIIDCFAEKLLANTDRWNDTSIESRDLIDLCALRYYEKIPDQAIEKANQAYPVINPLKNAILNFQTKPEYRARCFQSLEISNPRLIIDGLDLLAQDFGMDKTKRRNHEAGPEDHVHL